MKKPEEILGGEKKKEKKGKKHRFRETRIEHHQDGSHTVRHTPSDGGDEMSYAAPDLGGVHSGLDTNIAAQDSAPAAEPLEMDKEPLVRPMI